MTKEINNNQVNITNEEKQRLSELGVNECHPNYEFNDLKKILWCEDVAKKEKRISDKFSSGIHQITFLTPKFDSNFTCSIVIDNNSDVWVVAYNPLSQASKLKIGLAVVKVWSCLNANEAKEKALKSEKELNESNPILAVATSYRVSDKVNFEKVTSSPYVFKKDLIYSEMVGIPDDYISPLDIVKVNKGWNNQQFIIYLGQGQICNYTQEKGAHFDAWQNFFTKLSTNKDLTITCFHPIIPFKNKEDIVRHIAKAVNSNFGKGIKDFFDNTGYNWTYRNDEHFVNRCIYGIDCSQKVVVVGSDRKFNLEEEIKENSEKLDNLTSSDVSSEINYIKNLISVFSKSEQKNRFETHVLVKPKTSCKIQ